MTRKQQLLGVGIGAVLIAVCVVVAFLEPFPSPFLQFVLRALLALSLAGVAGLLPGGLEVRLGPWIRATGALAVFAIVYFFNPAQLATQGTPMGNEGLFLVRSSDASQPSTYYWHQARAAFSVPSERWRMSTEAAESGLGDLTLTHVAAADAEIQMHVSRLSSAQMESFKAKTVRSYENTLGMHGGFSTRDETIGGQPAFIVTARLPGQAGGLKEVQLAFVPMPDGTLLEVHLTHMLNDVAKPELIQDYESVLNSIEFREPGRGI